MYYIENFLKKIYGERFSGEFLSGKKGDGYDLEDFREYQVGDNIKKINWKLSAKYDKEYVSIYKQEQEPVVDIFIDLNINFSVFENDLKNYFSILELLFKQLGIKHNIYIVQTKKHFLKTDVIINKIPNFSEINYQKLGKSSINNLFNLKEFKTKHYKIIISDYVFLENKNLEEFVIYKDKIFFSVLDLYSLLEGGSFPVLNGYFDSLLCKDNLEEYKNLLDSLGIYGQVEKIISNK